MTQEQVATGDQSIVEGVDDLPAGALIEVDEHVPTKHDVDAPHGPRSLRVEEVDLPEVAEALEALDHVGAVAALLEVPLSHERGRGAKRAGAVHAATPRRHVGAAQVAPDHVDVPALEEPGLQDEDGQRIHLLTRGAAGAPHVEATLR